MIKKINKVLRIVLAAQVIVLGLLLLKPVFFDKAAMALGWANNTPESIIVTITGIELRNETTGAISYAFQGTKDIDLTNVSLTAPLDIDLNATPGTYTSIRISISNTYKLKGSVLLSGQTYYTKANHQGRTTGPSELETVTWNIAQWGSWYNEIRKFPAPITISKGQSFYLVVDSGYIMVYDDGTTMASKPAGMYLQSLPIAALIGAPGKVEIYDFQDDAVAHINGRLTLLLDSAGNVVGGTAHKTTDFGYNDSAFFIIGDMVTLVDNGNGTYTYTNGYVPDSTHTLTKSVLPAFKRSSHSGTYAVDFDIILGKSSGSYTCIKTQ